MAAEITAACRQSDGLVRRLAAAWHCATFIRWTG